MPAAVVKGIIVSISIITALGVAALENPQIQTWLEQQRRRVVELLRSIGEELDPESRRAAEAFAYEGKTPATDAGLRREASGSKDAAATATGRSLSSECTIRRIPAPIPTDPDEAEDRRRKGREYLAKRNQEMYELKQRKKAAKAEGTTTPPTPTSFDSIVDVDGRLRLKESGGLPSLPAKVEEVERNLTQPLLAESSTAASSGWTLGSRLANPFDDEYALDRSETPKPPVPPKVALEDGNERSSPKPSGGSTPRQTSPQRSRPDQSNEDLSYEEQIAVALSLSEAEAATAKSSQQQSGKGYDEELRAAIEASLKDVVSQSPASATKLQSSSRNEDSQPLVDLTPPSPKTRTKQPTPRGQWETIFDQDYSPSHEPLSLAHGTSEAEDEDELYRVTPDLTRARLASFDAEQIASPAATAPERPYDPVREAAGQLQEPQHDALEASFYSAASSAPSPASTRTPDRDETPQLVDIAEDAQVSGARTPASRSSFGFQSDSESGADTFASASAPASRNQSRPRSEFSNVEVVDADEDSDVDMLSEEGDGVATPDSWTEVGSRNGESEMEDELPRRLGAL